MLELTANNALDYLRAQGWIGAEPAQVEPLGGGVSNIVLRVVTPKRETLTWDTEDLGPEVYGDQYGISAIFPAGLLE